MLTINIDKIRFGYYFNTKLKQIQNMTTIAEFLDRTSGNYFEKQAKIKGWDWWMKGELNNQLNEDGITDIFNNYITSHPDYGIVKSTITNPEFIKAIKKQIQEATFNYYRDLPETVSLGDIGQQVGNRSYTLPSDLEKQILGIITNQIKNQFKSNPEEVYNIASGYIPKEYRPVLEKQIAANPMLKRELGETLIPYTEELFNGGIQGAVNPEKIQALTEEAYPDIQQKVLSSALTSLDLIPDDEAERLGKPEWNIAEEGIWGDDPRYKDYLKRYYDLANPNKSNQVVFGIQNAFENDPDARLAAINYYRNLPEDQRENAMLARWLRAGGNFANDLGQTEQGNNTLNAAKNLSSNMGQYGKSFIGNEGGDAEFGNQVHSSWEATQKNLKDNPVWQGWQKSWQTSPVYHNKTAIQQHANEIRDKRMEDSFYGWFKDPGVQKAFQYAMPFASYGIPLAMLASMSGNNSIWPLILLGGLGSGVLGYGNQNNWFGFDDKTKQSIDNFFGALNSPLDYVGGKFGPGAQLTLNKALGLKPPEKKEEPSPDAKTTVAITPPKPEPVKTNIEMPEFSSSGTAYASDYDANKMSNSYANSFNNPSMVRSMRLA